MESIEVRLMDLEDSNLRTRGLEFDGVAMARPPNQNPKKKRLT
jgi:hypothetical protein